MEITSRYDEALVWTSELHRDQRRKGGNIPYLSHLLSVSSLVIEHGGDEDQAIAGLLHDSIEDQGVTDAAIGQRFGPRVAMIVRACTDADVIPKPPWRERKEAYIARLADMPADALLVSLADKVHNTATIADDVARVGEHYFEIFKGRSDGTRWYYRRLLDAFLLRADELPPETEMPGGATLLGRLSESAQRIGATDAAAALYEAGDRSAGS